jgi:prepilin-type N-terminal cleavage/methylation domain-containing protein
MQQVRKAFTLIELIIVVVIIGILALVAIPRYFANIAKAQKNTVRVNLQAIRQAELDYYAVYGVYPAPHTFPIVVTIDGDAVVNLGRPNSPTWIYYYDNAVGGVIWAERQTGTTCYYQILRANGTNWGSTCTP